MGRSKKKKNKRNANPIIQNKLAFFGAYQNFLLLENVLFKNKKISLYQYCNYLSQVVYCTEAGLKNIINSNNLKHMHEIKVLFYNTPKPFQQEFRLLSNSIDDIVFLNYISKTEMMIDIFGHINIEKVLKELLDENSINDDGSVNIIRTTTFKSFVFLRVLLDEIYKFLNNQEKMLPKNYL